MKKSLLLTMRFGIAILLMSAIFNHLYTEASKTDTYYHENSHAMKCRFYGGIPNITYNKIDGGGKTVCTGEEVTAEGKFLDSAMEIVGYHTYATTNAMFMVAYAILLGLFILVYAILMEKINNEP